MRRTAVLLLSLVLVGCGDPGSAGAPPVATNAACPAVERDDLDGGSSAAIDWAEVVQLDGRQYMRALHDGSEVVAPAELGDVVGTVCFRLDGAVSNPGYRLVDGDATFLPVGTELRAIAGTDPELALAAVVDGGAIRYDSFEVVDPATADEALELDRTITRIVLLAPVSLEELGTIDDTAEIARLVDDLRGAPVEPDRQPDADATHLVRIERADGGSTGRLVWADIEVMEPGIAMSSSWIGAIDAAVARGPQGVTMMDWIPGVTFYGPCGNETLEWEGVTYYQLFPEELAQLDVSRYPTLPPPTTAPAAGFARVAPPGPGDDIGTLVLYSDGIARFESQSGTVEWLTTEPHAYDWVC